MVFVKNDKWATTPTIVANACLPYALPDTPKSPRRQELDWTPHLGDIVMLGRRAPAEFRSSSAIITKLALNHCTAIVLDPSHSFGICEVWPCYADVELHSNAWRINTKVIIDGLKGKRGQNLNGSSGIIRAHPRSGHPSFVGKPSDPDKAVLTICIQLDNPQLIGGEKSVLLEPRFLTPHDKKMEDEAFALEGMLRRISRNSDGNTSDLEPIPLSSRYWDRRVS